MSYDFQTTTYAKWILAGEHAVIRGHAALVFPINDKSLTLTFQKSTMKLQANYSGVSGAEMHLLFWSVLEQGMQILQCSLQDVNGEFHLHSNIPVGVGMGASAALCVAVARWFVYQALLSSDEVYSFAKQLENLFHGQSSGVDIAGVAATTGIYFQQGQHKEINQSWSPFWYLSSCGQMGITSHCINKVQELWEKDGASAQIIDKKMHESVMLACDALEEYTEQSTIKLAKAINEAADCFQRWGLVSESLQQHMQQLRDAGAIAVKPTGSGGGGYVVSLWNEPQNFDQWVSIQPIDNKSHPL